MKISICAHWHQQSAAERLAAHLRQALAAEVELHFGEIRPESLDDSDAIIGLTAADHPSGWLTHPYTLAPVRALLLLEDARPPFMPQPAGVLIARLRAGSWDADLAHLIAELNARLLRRTEARHEYNNIAAVVALSSDVAVRARAREALLELRARYPEYSADPDGLNVALGLS